MLMFICPGSGAQGCLKSPGDLAVVWRPPVSVSSPSWTTCGPDPPHPHVYSTHENSTTTRRKKILYFQDSHTKIWFMLYTILNFL